MIKIIILIIGYFIFDSNFFVFCDEQISENIEAIQNFKKTSTISDTLFEEENNKNISLHKENRYIAFNAFLFVIVLFYIIHSGNIPPAAALTIVKTKKVRWADTYYGDD